MDPLETRELGYFIAVAEELHFGRAAERLGIAQPALSRAVKQLERRLGVVLLERTSRVVRLTAAGETLLHEGRKALDAVMAAARRSQRAGRTEPALVLVMKPGGHSGLLSEILAAFAAGPAAVPVEPLICGIGEQAGVLRDGRADLGLVHLPFDDVSGFDTEELLAEGQVLVMPRGHRLAGRSGVRMADLDGEPMPRWPGMSEDEAPGPLIRDGAQLMQLVALGRAVAVLPESCDRRTDLAYVPVLDAPEVTTMLAWPERSRSRAVAGFVLAAADVADRRRRAGARIAAVSRT